LRQQQHMYTDYTDIRMIYTLTNADHLHEERELRELQAAVHVEVCDLERPAPELLFQVLRGPKAQSSMVGTHWFLQKRPAATCAWATFEVYRIPASWKIL